MVSGYEEGIAKKAGENLEVKYRVKRKYRAENK
jgi:hypothetical protein